MGKGYQLQPNENVLMRSSDFSAKNYTSSIQEVILTTKNLVVEWHGKKRGDGAGDFLADMGSTFKEVYTLGLIKDKNAIDVIPLRLIKTTGERAQVLLNTQSDSDRPTMDIYFVNGGQLSLYTVVDSWSEKRAHALEEKKLLPWVSAINQAVTGTAIPEAEITRSDAAKYERALPGSRFVAETLKDTVGTISDAFGVKFGAASKNADTPPQKVSTHCSGCGAPIHGLVGSVITCTYCDTQNQL